MKRIKMLFLLIILSIVFTACSKSETIKVGISGPDSEVWERMTEKMKDEGIDLEIVRFSDYVQPNMALAEGELDLNAFQTISYFDAFIEEHDLDLIPLATTYLAPMGLYSEKYESVEELPDGAIIALANEATNMGRGLLLLQEAGLITLEDDFDGLGSVDKVIDNPKNIQFELMVAGQTPRVMPDVDASIINNGIAVDAGLLPLEDAIFHEDETATPYLNIIAIQEKDKDNETLQKIADIYQTDEIRELIIEESKGNRIPTFVPLSDIDY